MLMASLHDRIAASVGWRQSVNEVSVVAEAQPATSRLRRSFAPTVKRWLREPLLHFLLIGVALFAVYAYSNAAAAAVESSKQIRLTPDDVLADGHLLRVAMASPAHAR